MTTIKGSLIKLKPEYEERYIILHKHTFPGVLERITKSNIRNYSIFLLDGILFSYYEYAGTDYKLDMEAMEDETTKEWWKLTDPMQESFPTRKEGEWWTEMEILQHFDEIDKGRNSIERHAYCCALKEGGEDPVKNLFENFNEKYLPFYTTGHLQNHTVFIKDNRLFTYYEYTGDDLMGDSEIILSHDPVKEWNREFNKYISVPWKEMKEVFHTD